MTLNRNRKILMAVLALGLGALVVDRAVLSSGTTGPTLAAAAPAAALPPASAADAGATPAIAASADALLAQAAEFTGRSTLARRLADHARTSGRDGDQPRDGFKPAASWTAQPTHADDDAPAAPLSEPLQRFVQTHQLQAVMDVGNSGGGIAIINGRSLRAGGTIDGFRLIDLRKRSVLLESEAGRVELRLTPEP